MKLLNITKEEAIAKITNKLEEFLSDIPETTEKKVKDPEKRANELEKIACIKAAGIAGTLALPPGPAGFATILPDIYLIWKIQAQLVADIAGCHGMKATLNKEQMLYCMFKHSASQAVRDIATRVGQRIVIQKVTKKLLQDVLKKVGIRVSQKSIGKSLSRFIPGLGAVGVAVYALYDTYKVAENAIEYFSQDNDIIYA